MLNDLIIGLSIPHGNAVAANLHADWSDVLIDQANIVNAATIQTECPRENWSASQATRIGQSYCIVKARRHHRPSRRLSNDQQAAGRGTFWWGA